MAFTDPDGNNPIAWIIAGAIMIGKWYHDGRKANGGEANPLDWDWKNANFVLGVSAGGGGNGFFGGLGWNNNYGVAMGVSNGELNLGYISNGTPVLAPLEDKVSEGWNIAEKQIKIAFEATNEYVSQVDWKEVGYSTLDYTRNAIGIVSDFCDANNISSKNITVIDYLSKFSSGYSIYEIYEKTKSGKSNTIEITKDIGVLGLSYSYSLVGLAIPFIELTYKNAANTIIDFYNKGNEYLNDLVSLKIYPY